ncbi:N-acetyltransferase family protein [Plesiomonas shigelloides]|uniref:GNAT family N-acetyltransferase n=1 Tax=Plesiomonas shigelloides TaxID=703 RepID=UPI00387F03CA
MKIEIGTLDDVLQVDAGIPEFDGRTTRALLEERLAGKSTLILIARAEGRAVAYKLGYAISEREFYSWLGGVLPEYRRKGIASELRQAQEMWAHEQGYHCVKVKSMNRYPAMLQLLIASGYHIVGYEESALVPECGEGKILFQRMLQAC